MQKTVLIVDDHAGFRRTVRRALELEGWEVVGEARDGAGGLEAAQQLQPDLVLLDIGLPDLDGIEVAGRMTTRDRSLAVVLTSSRDASDYRSLLASCGARGFIPKGELCGEAVSALTG